MVDDDPARAEAPPYISYTSFRNFINALASKGMPPQVDKAVLNSMSGSTQSALLSALRWLQLIDDNNVPQRQMHALVNASEADYAERLREVITQSYEFLTDGSLSLASATGAQLEQKFREYGIAGSTVTKSISFFIHACKDAGMTLGPYVKAPKVNKAGGMRRKPAANRRAPKVVDVPPPLVSRKSTAELLLEKFPDFDAEWSTEIKDKWFESFAKLQAMMAQTENNRGDN